MGVLLSGKAQAAGNNYYWDTTSGTWQTGSNWSTSSTGSPAGSVAPTSTSDTATFNGSSVTPTNETISLTASASVGALTFNNIDSTTLQSTGGPFTLTLGTTGVTINSGAGAVTIGNSTAANNLNLALSGSDTWTNNSSNTLTVVNGVTSSATTGTQTLTFAGTGNFALNGAIGNGGTGGTVALTQSGTGTTTLAGTDTNTGTTTINSGTLQVGNGSGGSVASTTAVTLNNGTFALEGNTTGNTSQTIASLTTTAGGAGATYGSSIVVNPDASGNGNAYTTTLTIGTLTPGAFNDLNINYNVGGGTTSGTTVGNNIVTLTNAPTLTNGIIGKGSVTVTDVNGTFFAQTNGSNQVVGLESGTALPTSGGTNTVNYFLSGSQSQSGNTVGNTITINAGNSGGTLTTGGFLTLSTGGNGGGVTIYGSSAYTISGQIKDGQTTAQNPIYFNNYDTGIVSFGGFINGTNPINVFGGTGTTVITGNMTTGSGGSAYTIYVDGTGTLQIGNGSSGSLGALLWTGVSGGSTLAFDMASGSTTNSNQINSGGTVAGAEGSGITNTINGTIIGAGSFIQRGLGTTILSVSNSYTGTTTVNAGTLQVAQGASTGYISSSSALIMGGGTFYLNPSGYGGGNTNQTFASLTTTANTDSQITINPVVGGYNSYLAFTSNTPNIGANSAVNFNLSLGTTNVSTGQNLTNLGNSIVEWNPALNNGIIGGGYTVTDDGGTGFATVYNNGVLGNTIVRLADYGSSALPTSGGSATGNYFVDNANYGTGTGAGGLTEALTGGVAANTVTVTTTGLTSGANLALGGNTLTLGGGGGMLFSGGNPYSITASGGGITASTAASTIYLDNYNGSGVVTISAPILDNSGTSVVFTGTGQTTLSGANTYSGQTLVEGGIAEFGTEASLYSNNSAKWTAANIVVGPGGTLAFAVGGANQFTSSDLNTLLALGTATGGFENNSNIGLDTTGGNFAYNTAITNTNGGANSVGLTKLGSNTLTLGAAETYTGATAVNAGTLQISGSGSINASTIYVNGGTLALNVASAVNGSTVIFNSGALTESVANAITGSSALTVNGNLTLATANNYSGLTTVNNGGTLQIGSGGASPTGGVGTGNYTVNSGGTLIFALPTSSSVSGTIANSGTVYAAEGSGITNSLAGLTGTGTFIQSGLGTTSDAGTSFSEGNIQVNAGTLYFSVTNGSVNTAAALTLGGGTINNHLSAGSGAQGVTFTSLTTTAGTASTLAATEAYNTNKTLTTITSPTITAGAGAAVNFNYIAAGSNATNASTGKITNVVAFGGTPTQGFMGGGYTVTDTGGVGFATINSSGYAVRLADASPYSNGLPVTTGSSSGNYYVSSNYSTSSTSTPGSLVEQLTASSSVAANSVNVSTTGLTSGANLALNGDTLTLTSGGGMVFSGANPYTISSGTNISSSGAGTITSSAAGTIYFDNFLSGSSALTINAPIADYSGTGTAVAFVGGNYNATYNVLTTLSGANTYTGATYVESPSGVNFTLDVTGSLANASAISVAAPSTLEFNEANNSTQSNTITDNGTLVGFETTGITNTLSGAIGGTGSFTQTGAGTTVLSSSTGNTYSGGTTLTTGTFYASNPSGSAYSAPSSDPRVISVTGTPGSATGTGAVTVQTGATLAGGGTIAPTVGGVTVQTGGTLFSGGTQTTAAGKNSTITGTGLTLNNAAGLSSILSVNAGSTLSFALGAGASTGTLAYSTPNQNSTYLNIAGNGAAEVNFATSGNAINLDLVDLTATAGATGLHIFSIQNPYLLIQAGSDNDYNLETTNGYDVNGYVLGTSSNGGSSVDASIFNLEVTALGSSTPLSLAPYGTLDLYLYNGDLEVVPEPSTWAMMIGGLALLLLLQRRRKSSNWGPTRDR